MVTNGIHLDIRTAGHGDPVVLLHGWPHTHRVWDPIVAALAADHLVITPDLRGLGASERPADGYDLDTLAGDVMGVLDGLGLPTAKIVGIDLGGPIAFMTALREPHRISRLVVMEALIGTLPGAGKISPWWFGFHAVPGLPATVLAGHEREYLDFFYRSGTLGRGIPPEIRDAFVEAYTGVDVFHHYRAMPGNAALISDAVQRHRLTVPTATIGGATVGDSTFRQLEPITDTLESHLIPDGGHILPLDRPDELLNILVPFLGHP
ncbi:alpha/beta fold hydrolase [Actinoplanes sp. NPDC051494]|uniref:alpha/beta fold hydrolase n=1 Tax=Actinoplanes sp. NPDC051494 TaxID=3363907 RepID=UPI0037BBB25B